MGKGTSTFLVAGTLIFGVLVGALLLGLIGLQTGRLSLVADDVNAIPTIDSFTPGMDKLNALSCRNGETKHMIIGGVEDNYQPGLDTHTPIPAYQEAYTKSLPTTGSVDVTRGFDEGGQNNQFLDRAYLPPNIQSGLFVIRSRPTAQFDNDILKLSHWIQDTDDGPFYEGDTHWIALPDAPNKPQWEVSGDMLSVPLEAVDFFSRKTVDRTPTTPDLPSLLALSQSAPAPVEINISMGDDRIVDFYGFAACTAPTENLGVSFQIKEPHKSGAYVELDCVDFGSDKRCNTNTGNLSCDAAIPLACFAFNNTPVPAVFTDSQDIESWSAGSLQFTDPVIGRSIKSQDAAHNLCRAQFGDRYRTANIHDGFAVYRIIAEGRKPDAVEAWVESKDETYANCWPLRSDYTQAQNAVTGGAR